MSKRYPGWRSIGSTGDNYPDWLRELVDASGVYAIRTVGLFKPTVVYVGESHTNRLAKTLTRHFQTWTRSKGWWSGMFGSDADPGRTYARGACEVLVRICPPYKAIDLQHEWIKKFHPRDNVLGWSPGDYVPF